MIGSNFWWVKIKSAIVSPVGPFTSHVGSKLQFSKLIPYVENKFEIIDESNFRTKNI